MAPRPVYDHDGIARALKFHAVEAPMTYHGWNPGRKTYDVTFTADGNVRGLPERVHLSAREAWLTTMALAAGRAAGVHVVETHPIVPFPRDNAKAWEAHLLDGHGEHVDPSCQASLDDLRRFHDEAHATNRRRYPHSHREATP